MNMWGKRTMMKNTLSRIATLFAVLIMLTATIPFVAAQSLPNIILCDAFSVGDTNREIPVGEPLSFFSTVINLNGSSMQYSYHWNFGDGSTTSSANAVHLYHSEGPKTVTLFVAEQGNPGNSCVDTLSLNVVPMPFDTPPVATIFLTNQHKDELLAGKPVAFSSSVVDLEGDQVSYHWNFGDGSTSAAQHPTHVFKDAGKRRVTLTVTQVDDPS